MDWRERIVNEPIGLFGKLQVRGTGISVSTVLTNLAAALNHEEVLEAYPSLTKDDIRACIAFAAELTRERVMDLRTLGECPPAFQELVLEIVRNSQSRTRR